MSASEVDLFVIGGGSGGVRAARIAASHGARVAIAESDRWGGTCVLRGCIPKKLLVYASETSAAIADAEGFGWQIGSAHHDWPQLIRATEHEVTRLSGLYARNLDRVGAQLVVGHARLVDRHTVVVGDDEFRTKHIVIATGSHPRPLQVVGGDLAISSNEIFRLPTRPERILIVGGGYIGVEFAHIFAGLGSQVTLVHRGDQVLPGFDHDLRVHADAGLRAHGVTVIANDEPRALEARDGAIGTEVASGWLESDVVLAALGRRANTAGLGLSELGVAMSPLGAVVVDEWSTTSVSNIHAVGDVAGHIGLTPVAIREGHAVADRLFGSGAQPVDRRWVPTAVFSQPAIASVGLTEAAARAAGHELQLFTSVFRPLRHTLSGRDEKAFIKLVVDAVSRRVLGVHMVGHEAPEVIQAAAIAITMGATKDDFDRTMALHPTLAEELVLLR